MGLTLGCVLLASGEGRRFGGNKLLAPLGDGLLIERALRLVGPEWKRVAVVRDEAVGRLCAQAGFAVVKNPYPDASDSIRLGIRQMAGVHGCLFLVGDQPLIRRSSVEKLVRRFAADPSRIVRLGFGDQPGNPVLFPADLFSELAALAPGERGSKVIRAHRERALLVEAESPDELVDVDTPDQLQWVQQALRNKEES